MINTITALYDFIIKVIVCGYNVPIKAWSYISTDIEVCIIYGVFVAVIIILTVGVCWLGKSKSFA